MKLAMLLSCGSFEGFFGGIQGQTRDSYLASYRGDWSWYYARGLADNGITATLYIPSLLESGRYTTDAGIDVRFLKMSRLYRPLETVLAKRLTRRNRWLLYADERLNTIAFMPSLHAAMAADDIDMLYVQEHWSGRFDHVVHRIGVPVVTADHGGVAGHVVKAFKRAAFRKAAVSYAQTRPECGRIAAAGGTPVYQPNGCESGFFFPASDVERSKTILTVARLTDRQKRTSDLVRALALLPDDWTLDIVGTGPDLPKLQGLARSLGLTGRVRFHGFLDRAGVRLHLQRCGVYCMPSANEAVAIAALEAMGCGASVVLSRIPAFAELVDDGVDGALTPVGDPGRLAEAIAEAWIHRDARGRAAVHTVRERYDTARLYRALANSLRQHARAVAREGATMPAPRFG